MKYPRVMSEDATIDALLAGASIARFGDGELRVAIGKSCTSQGPEPKLAAEMRAMLGKPNGCLVGIPNWIATPKRENWTRYAQPVFTNLYLAKEYASSFITRPDSAPWIDRPDYWHKVRQLWAGQHIVLVVGDRKSITPEMMMQSGARSVREVFGPRQHAYVEIDRIEAEIGDAKGARVILCLGATATALAFRLAAKGIHALDLGHIGMFMRHAGAYRYLGDDLASPKYRAQLNKLHANRKWGADGGKHAQAVIEFADMLKAVTILDYGCGRGELAKALEPRRVMQYDPGIEGREGLPKPVDLVVCTDVLEHVEPKKIEAVLDHIFRLSGMGAYLVISTREANVSLPNGKNAHLIVQPAVWWRTAILRSGWHDIRILPTPKDVTLWLKK